MMVGRERGRRGWRGTAAVVTGVAVTTGVVGVAAAAVVVDTAGWNGGGGKEAVVRVMEVRVVAER